MPRWPRTKPRYWHPHKSWAPRLLKLGPTAADVHAMDGVTGIDPLARDGEFLPPPAASSNPEWMHIPQEWLSAAGRTDEPEAVSDSWDRPDKRKLTPRQQNKLDKRLDATAGTAISTIVNGDGALPSKRQEGPSIVASLGGALLVAFIGSWGWYQGVLRLRAQMPWAPIFIGVLVAWALRLGVRNRDGIRIGFGVVIVLYSSLSVISSVARFGELTAFRASKVSLLKLPFIANPFQLIGDFHERATQTPLIAVMVLVGLVACGVIASHEV